MLASQAALLALRAGAARTAEGADMPSPCISVCRMDPDSGLCMGCFRSLDEIVAWSRMPADDKRAVWRLIEQRGGITGVA